MSNARYTIAGGGRLEPSWFTPYDLDELLSEWVDAVTPGSDEFVEAQVYATGFSVAVDLFMSSPAHQKDRNKTDSFITAQVEYWRDEASAWRSKAFDLAHRGASPFIVPWEGR